MSRQRRRATRIADVDYDRSSDAPVTGENRHDDERIVELDEDSAEQLTGVEFYLNERPPHHG